jgi:hypothetical protein
MLTTSFNSWRNVNMFLHLFNPVPFHSVGWLSVYLTMLSLWALYTVNFYVNRHLKGKQEFLGRINRLFSFDYKRVSDTTRNTSNCSVVWETCILRHCFFFSLRTLFWKKKKRLVSSPYCLGGEPGSGENDWASEWASEWVSEPTRSLAIIGAVNSGTQNHLLSERRPHLKACQSLGRTKICSWVEKLLKFTKTGSAINCESALEIVVGNACGISEDSRCISCE